MFTDLFNSAFLWSRQIVRKIYPKSDLDFVVKGDLDPWLCDVCELFVTSLFNGHIIPFEVHFTFYFFKEYVME